MVTHEPQPTGPHPLKKLGAVVLWGLAMVTGSTLLIAAFPGADDTRMVGQDGKPVTRFEVVMESAAERALVSPTTAVLAGNPTNERRGF